MAGEIQLNSTTMATESSGSITLSNVDSVTNRTNLGLGSLATQDANAVALTGGSLTGTEIDLKSSGTTLYASNGSTSLISESSGTVTVDNVTLGSNVSGIGQLVGVSYVNSMSGNGNYVTLENNKTYHLVVTGYASSFGWTEYYRLVVDGSGNVSPTEQVTIGSTIYPESTTNAVRVGSSTTDQGYFAGLVFEQGSTFDAS